MIDHFINRKKNPSKNSVKIKKLLSSFLSKGVEQIKTHSFLEFISNKHKVPIEVLTRTPKLQSGYVSSLPLSAKQTSIASENIS